MFYENKKLFTIIKINLILLFYVIFSLGANSAIAGDDAKDELDNAVLSFINDKQNISKNMNNDFKAFHEELVAKARKKDADFDSILTKWEQTNKKIAELDQKFNKIVGSADGLFDFYYKEAKGIKVDKIRKGVIQQLKESEGIYKKALINTKKTLMKLSEVYVEVESYIKAAKILKSVDALIESFSEVSDNAENIMEELGEIQKETQELLEQDYGL